ncbi:hypothetical protein ABZ883_39000 [Streptomyces sp. NPDC046977]|uniref:hypothetical protein n=1 Tax=Streptomyces sp. NPDC046977 TaxID=3154703 RepID=UPI0033FF8550
MAVFAVRIALSGLDGDVDVPEGGEVFALRPAGLDASRVRLLSAADVVAALTPAS